MRKNRVSRLELKVRPNGSLKTFTDDEVRAEFFRRWPEPPPLTKEEIEAKLRAAGYDPEKLRLDQ